MMLLRRANSILHVMQAALPEVEGSQTGLSAPQKWHWLPANELDRSSAGSRCHIAVAAIALLFASPVFAADDLPRDPAKPKESYPGVEVIYDTVVAPNRQKLRAIVTRPEGSQGKLPVIFLAGWLSCDSVEAPEGTNDASGLAFRNLVTMPGYCTFRIDKPGVGDSEGDCGKTDFDTELAAYRAAFRLLANYDFIDDTQVYILGVSNGGGFAPLVAETDTEQAHVAGYVVVGGWVKTWFEHMLEIERRRFTLMGRTPAQVNERMKGVATLYHELLFKHRPAADILSMQPKLVELWPDGADRQHLYGRPLAFYHQLQKLNLAAAWSKVKVPTLVLHGQYDWIMSREDHEIIEKIVNSNTPGAARFVELPNTGHTFQHYESMADAFAGKEAPFDPNVTRLIIDWFKQRAEKSGSVTKPEP